MSIYIIKIIDCFICFSCFGFFRDFWHWPWIRSKRKICHTEILGHFFNRAFYFWSLQAFIWCILFSCLKKYIYYVIFKDLLKKAGLFCKVFERGLDWFFCGSKSFCVDFSGVFMRISDWPSFTIIGISFFCSGVVIL